MKVVNLLEFLNSAKDLFTLPYAKCDDNLVNFLDLMVEDEQFTQKIDLGEIQNAIALKAVDSINKGIEELEGQKIKSDRNIDEIDGRIANQNEEKALLEEEKKNKQNELYEVCRDVEQQKQLANEYIKKQDKVSKEQEELNELYSNMTLVKEYNSPSANDSLLKEEEPKKVVNISNPFDRIRDLEEPITSRTARH